MAGLGAEAGRLLLAMAREAITAQLEGRDERGAPTPGALVEPRGAFVTLRRRSDGELRGCIGYLEPARPLGETVARAAAAAATHDGRFAPVTLEELPHLSLEVSVLGPLRPIAPRDVRVATHGLLIRQAGRSGLLLPQVAVEHSWDAETFLDHVCRKAGLPPESWRQPNVELLGFTAEVFSEA